MTGRLPESFGRFVVIEEIGHGAMGVVYRARDPMIDRVVAIKTITLAGTEEERAHFEARFQQEARAAGGLAHPAIVTIFDYGREGDTAFMAMEVLEGRELRDLIRGGGIPPAEAVEIAARVAEALAFAHERGVVHRDVKPGNIMVLADGRVKIMDFGIARLDEPGVKTATGLLLGSPRYMAPEQAAGEPFDGRADIFSLGVVLYEMLTGAAPFAGDDIPQLMFQLMNAAVPPPSRARPELPAVLDYIVARALKKNPQERYGSAEEFARDLRASLPEVQKAQAEAATRSGAATLRIAPLPEAKPETPRRPVFTADNDLLALRPSPRFDDWEGLARLAVLPLDATRSIPVAAPTRRRRVDLQFVAVVAGYVLATGVAAYILLS
ncbi:MAG: serine/threonine protein kinase [Betaproteobacteria bacterium]|nr:serine/threonine protein kinase [Betaproteobacteria bacterium]